MRTADEPVDIAERVGQDAPRLICGAFLLFLALLDADGQRDAEEHVSDESNVTH